VQSFESCQKEKTEATRPLKWAAWSSHLCAATLAKRTLIILISSQIFFAAAWHPKSYFFSLHFWHYFAPCQPPFWGNVGFSSKNFRNRARSQLMQICLDRAI
jgi:hypothetical protein